MKALSNLKIDKNIQNNVVLVCKQCKKVTRNIACQSTTWYGTEFYREANIACWHTAQLWCKSQKALQRRPDDLKDYRDAHSLKTVFKAAAGWPLLLLLHCFRTEVFSSPLSH